jgi:DNA/RNA non-specific endonuclease
MLDYSGIDALLIRITPGAAELKFTNEVVPFLVDIWVADYARTTRDSEIVETTVGRFSYLFDVEQQRLIAAWGITRGRRVGKRDSSRMAGHPQSAGKRYQRGHAIAHALGGGTDINLVTQLGSVNMGPFRALEREAGNTPGALYFTYWTYGESNAQRPTGVQQGLLVPGQPAKLREHAN